MTTLCPPGKRALCPLLPIDTLVGFLLIVGKLLVLCLLLLVIILILQIECAN